MGSDNRTFRIGEDIEQLGIKGGYFCMDFDPQRAQPDQAFKLLSVAVHDIRISQTDLAADSVLQGFRGLHTQVGVSNRKHIASPENLISLILAGRDVPDINPIVNVYNAVSLRSKLALGAHDLTYVHGPIVLRRTTGQEHFLPLGSNESKMVGAGEYAYIDEGANEILCRLETRQCEATKVSAASTSCFFIVQGNAASSTRDIQETVAELQRGLVRYCGGTQCEEMYWLNMA